MSIESQPTTPPKKPQSAKPDVFDNLLVDAIAYRVVAEVAQPTDAEDPLGRNITLRATRNNINRHFPTLQLREDVMQHRLEEARQDASATANRILQDAANGGSGERVGGKMNGDVIVQAIASRAMNEALKQQF